MVRREKKNLQEKGHGGELNRFCATYGVAPSMVIDYSTNINPLPSPSLLHEVLWRTVKECGHYPDSSYQQLRTKLGTYYEVDGTNIVCGNGSIEIIYTLVRMLNPRKALIVEPNFSEYRQALEADNIEILDHITTAANNYKADIHRLCESLSSCDIIFLSNPNNPAGHLYTQAELTTLCTAALKEKTTVIIDEAFMDFIHPAGMSMLSLVTEYPNLIVLRSLTKVLSLAGVRLGFAAADQNLISLITRGLPTWNVNIFASAVGKEIESFRTYIEKSRMVIAKARGEMYNELSDIGSLTVYPTAANYFLCKLPAGQTTDALQHHLASYNFYIRNCSNFHGLSDSHFRITIKDEKTNRRLSSCIKLFCDRTE